MQVIHSFSWSVHLCPLSTWVLSPSNTHSETNTYTSEHTYTGRSDVALFLIARLYRHRRGSRNQGVCADNPEGSWEEGSLDEYTSMSNPKHTHKRHSISMLHNGFTMAFTVRLDTLHWQVKHGSSVANTSLPISASVQLLRGSETQTTRIKQSVIQLYDKDLKRLL